MPATAPTSSVRSGPPESWYHARPLFDAPVMRRQSRASSPSFALRADGLQDERAVGAPVEADRGHATLRDG